MVPRSQPTPVIPPPRSVPLFGMNRLPHNGHLLEPCRPIPARPDATLRSGELVTSDVDALIEPVRDVEVDKTQILKNAVAIRLSGGAAIVTPLPTFEETC